MQSVRELCVQWLAVADRVGWGIEGPPHARAVRAHVQRLARLETDASIDELPADRALGVRPVDALSEAAELLGEAAAATGGRRSELLSAARGWLVIADS